MNNDDILDEIALQQGEEVKEGQYVTVSGEEAEGLIEKANNTLNRRIYDEGAELPMPGESVAPYLDKAKEIDKDSAISDLIAQSAILKAKRESEEQAKEQAKKPLKLTKAQKEEQKKRIVEYILQQQEEAFFVEHHHIMDGQTRRRTRSMISKMYDKGKFTPKKGSVNLND